MRWIRSTPYTVNCHRGLSRTWTVEKRQLQIEVRMIFTWLGISEIACVPLSSSHFFPSYIIQTITFPWSQCYLLCNFDWWPFELERKKNARNQLRGIFSFNIHIYRFLPIDAPNNRFAYAYMYVHKDTVAFVWSHKNHMCSYLLFDSVFDRLSVLGRCELNLVVSLLPAFGVDGSLFSATTPSLIICLHSKSEPHVEPNSLFFVCHLRRRTINKFKNRVIEVNLPQNVQYFQGMIGAKRKKWFGYVIWITSDNVLNHSWSGCMRCVICVDKIFRVYHRRACVSKCFRHVCALISLRKADTVRMFPNKIMTHGPSRSELNWDKRRQTW